MSDIVVNTSKNESESDIVRCERVGDTANKKGGNIMGGIGLPELIIIAIIGLLVILPYWKIFSKAGFSGWLSLTQLVPILNIIVVFYLAFAEWPVQRELNRVKQGSDGGGVA